jgi:hypothetical protein
VDLPVRQPQDQREDSRDDGRDADEHGASYGGRMNLRGAGWALLAIAGIAALTAGGTLLVMASPVAFFIVLAVILFVVFGWAFSQ